MSYRCIISSISSSLRTLISSILSWSQARVLGAAEGRRDVTAQPHGVSTIVFFAYTLLIMGPEWRNTGSFEVAWATGLFAATVREPIVWKSLHWHNFIVRCLDFKQVEYLTRKLQAGL